MIGGVSENRALGLDTPETFTSEENVIGADIDVIFDKGLNDNGGRFAACGNTRKKMTKQLGKEPVLNSNATVVPAGVVRIVDLVNEGYILVKP